MKLQISLPCTARTHYKRYKENNKYKLNILNQEVIDIKKQIKEYHSYLLFNVEDLNNKLHIKLNKYNDFINNKYEDGKFLSFAKRLYNLKNVDTDYINDVNCIYTLAIQQRVLIEKEKQIDVCNKVLNLDISNYMNYIKKYMIEVHKQMVLLGNAYKLSKKIGPVCINRILCTGSNYIIDYQATLNNKKRLLAEGKPLYSIVEKQWCEKNNIPYTIEPYTVYKKNDVSYEFVLTRNTIRNVSVKFKVSKFKSRQLASTYNEIIKSNNNDIFKICNLEIDLKQKLNMCLLVDTKLYTKFIRNENQESIVTAQTIRKDR